MRSNTSYQAAENCLVSIFAVCRVGLTRRYWYFISLLFFSVFRMFRFQSSRKKKSRFLCFSQSLHPNVRIKTRGVVGHPVGTKFLSLYIMYIWRWLVFFIYNSICFFIFCPSRYSLDLCASVLGFFYFL
jgi:hypothetical protein